MKRIAIIFASALLAVVLLGACGRGGEGGTRDRDESDNDPIITNGPGIPGGGPVLPGIDTGAGGDEGARFVPAVRDLGFVPFIRWGFNPLPYGPDVFCLDTGAPTAGLARYLNDEQQDPSRRQQVVNNDVENFLSTHFGVQLAGVHTPDVGSAVSQGAHIFPAGVHVPAPGQYRTIPEEMLRRYAPNYAALLDAHGGWEVSRAPDGEQLALNMFNHASADLSMFSVYRLDVLEGYGIAPPGPLTRVADGVYFSPDSFTRHDFWRIMSRLTYSAANTSPYALGHPQLTEMWSYRIFGMGFNSGLMNLGREDVWETFAPILGMFGVNMGIMEQDGYAMPFFATRAFRDAAFFIADLSQQGYMPRTFDQSRHVAFTHPQWRVGWTTVHIDELFQVITRALQNDPTRRFLITPPEEGDHGNRGVGLLQSEPWNPDGIRWHVGLHVTDDELSRILNMFDGISFDPRVHAVVRHGIYAESPFYDGFNVNLWGTDAIRLVWDGEPYEANFFTTRPLAFVLREGVFFTGIIDGETWPPRLGGGFDAVNNFARSAEGRALNLLPTRTSGEFTAQRAALEALHWDALHNLALTFIIEAGELQIVEPLTPPQFFTRPEGIADAAAIARNDTDSWNRYMNALNEHGLTDFIALYSQMPMR